MGGKSTLHSAVLGDDAVTQAQSFDLRSWQGLTYVLKIGKESLTEPGAYAEFRNLVLQYAQQGGDAEIKARIDAIIESFTKKDAPKGEEQKVEPAVVTPLVAPVDSPREEEKIEKEPEPLVTVGRRVQPQFSVEEKTSDVPLVSQEEKKEIPDAFVTQVKIEREPEIVPEQNPVFKSLDDHRARIGEIKRSVHDHIGNPVALMGLPNNIGKNYMSALLSALKATSAGGVGNAESTMMELESAYQSLVQVEATVKEEPVQPTVQKPETVVVEAPSPAPVVEIPVDVVPQREVIETPIPETSSPSAFEAEPTPSPLIVPEPIPESAPIKEEVVLEKIVDEPKEEIVPEVPKDETEPRASLHETFQSSFQKSDDTISSVVGSVHRNKHSASDTLASLLEDEEVASPVQGEQKEEPKLRNEEQEESEVTPAFTPNKWTSRGTAITPSERLSPEEVVNSAKIVVKQSELFSAEITTMLNKLLHEWSIFGGSGIFGTGPGGAEHPLYLVLGPLTMGEVLAGRWEGTDPKIIKVIKQYVDAWRHEQGIMYTINETFEHYLRRVVQRILKRQNG